MRKQASTRQQDPQQRHWLLMMLLMLIVAVTIAAVHFEPQQPETTSSPERILEQDIDQALSAILRAAKSEQLARNNNFSVLTDAIDQQLLTYIQKTYALNEQESARLRDTYLQQREALINSTHQVMRSVSDFKDEQHTVMYENHAATEALAEAIAVRACRLLSLPIAAQLARLTADPSSASAAFAAGRELIVPPCSGIITTVATHHRLPL